MSGINFLWSFTFLVFGFSQVWMFPNLLPIFDILQMQTAFFLSLNLEEFLLEAAQICYLYLLKICFHSVDHVELWFLVRRTVSNYLNLLLLLWLKGKLSVRRGGRRLTPPLHYWIRGLLQWAEVMEAEGSVAGLLSLCRKHFHCFPDSLSNSRRTPLTWTFPLWWPKRQTCLSQFEEQLTFWLLSVNFSPQKHNNLQYSSAVKTSLFRQERRTPWKLWRSITQTDSRS